MNKLILQAKAIHKAYGNGPSEVKVLRGASLEVARGEFLVIMGSSGSGKSTLLHILGALDAPDRGSVHFQDQNVFEVSPRDRGLYRNRDVGFVFQFYHLLPELNVLENAMMTAMVGTGFWPWLSIRREARRRAEDILARVGLDGRLKHRPSELSGGERQRVAIARALVNGPALLLADEPTGNLDEATGAGILRLLTELNSAGQTIVMVTHDAKVASLAHRCVHLTSGVVKQTGSPGATPVGAAPQSARAAL